MSQMFRYAHSATKTLTAARFVDQLARSEPFSSPTMEGHRVRSAGEANVGGMSRAYACARTSTLPRPRPFTIEVPELLERLLEVAHHVAGGQISQSFSSSRSNRWHLGRGFRKTRGAVCEHTCTGEMEASTSHLQLRLLQPSLSSAASCAGNQCSGEKIQHRHRAGNAYLWASRHSRTGNIRAQLSWRGACRERKYQFRLACKREQGGGSRGEQS